MATVRGKLDFLPISVWHLKKSKYWADKIRDTGDIEKTRRSSNCKHLPNLKYSEFNPDVAQRVILFWSNKNELIVDPFAGRSTRAVVSMYLNRNYQGYEIAPKTYEEMLSKIKKVPKSKDIGSAEIFLDDGCKMNQTNNNEADLVFTCPPYHQLEKYESVDNQLSDIRDYDKFLDRIKECSKNIFRVLKPGRFCVWVVADWRLNGFKCFHKDSIDIFQESGFKLWDIVINQLNSPFPSFQIRKCYKNCYTSKSHEYILVFKKEGENEFPLRDNVELDIDKWL